MSQRVLAGGSTQHSESRAPAIVLERMERLQLNPSPAYLAISTNLLSAGVNQATIGVVAPRIYGDLLRMAQFEEIGESFRERLTNAAAVDSIPQSPEAKADFLALQKRGIELWAQIADRQATGIVDRITAETGVTDPEVFKRILAVRPDVPLPDIHMTNGIQRN